MRGLRDDKKRRAIFNYYKKRADILCFQETHSDLNTQKIWRTEWGGVCFFAHCSSASAGVCILINRNFYCNVNKVLIDHKGRYVICELIMENDTKLTICAIYAPNTDSPSFFEALSQNLMDFEQQKIIIGDFNLVLNAEIDRYGSSYNNKKAAKRLKDLMNEENLCDVWRVRNPDITRFSWFRDMQCSRIDYALISVGISSMCENITYLQGIYSDHSAVFMAIRDIKSERGPGYWKLNISILESSENIQQCLDLVQKEKDVTKQWSSIKRYERIKQKLTQLLQSISRNAAEGKKHIISSLSEAVDDYQQRMPLNAEDMENYTNTKNELESLLTEKARAAMFRCKAKWMAEGEKNSKYFLNLEKRRYSLRVCHSILKRRN